MARTLSIFINFSFIFYALIAMCIIYIKIILKCYRKIVETFIQLNGQNYLLHSLK